MKNVKTAFLASLLLLTAHAIPASAEPVLETTEKDRKEIAFAIYNQDFALVREVRTLEIPAGTSGIKILGVPKTLQPETVDVQSLTAPAEFQVLEQTYQYDVPNPKNLLDKFVGKKIKVLNWNQFQDKKETAEAMLLSNETEPVLRIGKEIYIGYPGIKVLPEMPDGLVLSPTLLCRATSTTAKTQDLEISYLAGSLRWKADYVLTMDESSSSAQLTAWATLTNESGSSYENARLKLVAGNVNRHRPPMPKMMAMRAAMPEQSFAEGVQEKEVFEYHAYELARKINLGNCESKQEQLFRARQVKFVKEYSVEDSSTPWARQQGAEKEKVPVKTALKFTNSEENGLGGPLPEGTVRVYGIDKQNARTFLGEDSIAHTPKKGELKIRVGEAFDISAEKKQTDYQQPSKNTYESEWEIKIKNAKKEDVEVAVLETLSGNWQMISQSQPLEKVNAFTVKFKVKVPKKGEAAVRYRVRVGQ